MSLVRTYKFQIRCVIEAPKRTTATQNRKLYNASNSIFILSHRHHDLMMMGLIRVLRMLMQRNLIFQSIDQFFVL